MRRETYPKEFKEQIICEVRKIGNASKVAKRHEIAPSTIHHLLKSASHKAWEMTPLFMPVPQIKRRPLSMLQSLKVMALRSSYFNDSLKKGW